MESHGKRHVTFTDEGSVHRLWGATVILLRMFYSESDCFSLLYLSLSLKLIDAGKLEIKKDMVVKPEDTNSLY